MVIITLVVWTVVTIAYSLRRRSCSDAVLTWMRRPWIEGYLTPLKLSLVLQPPENLGSAGRCSGKAAYRRCGGSTSRCANNDRGSTGPSENGLYAGCVCSSQYPDIPLLCLASPKLAFSDPNFQVVGALALDITHGLVDAYLQACHVDCVA